MVTRRPPIDLNNQHITFAYNGGNFQPRSTITQHHDVFVQRRLSPDHQGPGRPHRDLHASRRKPDRRDAARRAHLGLCLRLGRPAHPDHRSHVPTRSRSPTTRRVASSTITRPDSTTEKFTNDQESGWTNSGTSGSPAPATLLAQAGGTYTSPNSNATTIQPDWLGMGLAGNIIDPLGNVQLFDRNANGLATVAIDQVNRNTQYTYDSKGNVTSILYEDGTSESFHLQQRLRAAHV